MRAYNIYKRHSPNFGRGTILAQKNQDGGNEIKLSSNLSDKLKGVKSSNKFSGEQAACNFSFPQTES